MRPVLKALKVASSAFLALADGLCLSNLVFIRSITSNHHKANHPHPFMWGAPIIIDTWLFKGYLDFLVVLRLQFHVVRRRNHLNIMTLVCWKPGNGVTYIDARYFLAVYILSFPSGALFSISMVMSAANVGADMNTATTSAQIFHIRLPSLILIYGSSGLLSTPSSQFLASRRYRVPGR